MITNNIFLRYFLVFFLFHVVLFSQTGLVLVVSSALGLGLAMAVSRFAYDDGANGRALGTARAFFFVPALFLFCRLTGRALGVSFNQWCHTLGLVGLVLQLLQPLLFCRGGFAASLGVFALELLGLGIELLDGLLGLLVLLDDLGRSKRTNGRTRVIKDARERVVVAGGDRVELVIVAARAGDGEPHEGACGHVKLLINSIHDKLSLVTVV